MREECRNHDTTGWYGYGNPTGAAIGSAIAVVLRWLSANVKCLARGKFACWILCSVVSKPRNACCVQTRWNSYIVRGAIKQSPTTFPAPESCTTLSLWKCYIIIITIFIEPLPECCAVLNSLTECCAVNWVCPSSQPLRSEIFAMLNCSIVNINRCPLQIARIEA